MIPTPFYVQQICIVKFTKNHHQQKNYPARPMISESAHLDVFCCSSDRNKDKNKYCLYLSLD